MLPSFDKFHSQFKQLYLAQYGVYSFSVVISQPVASFLADSVYRFAWRTWIYEVKVCKSDSFWPQIHNLHYRSDWKICRVILSNQTKHYRLFDFHSFFLAFVNLLHVLFMSWLLFDQEQIFFGLNSGALSNLYLIGFASE